MARQRAEPRLVVAKVFVNMPTDHEHANCASPCLLQGSRGTLGIGTTSPRIVNQQNGLGVKLASGVKLLLAVLVIRNSRGRPLEKPLETIRGWLHCSPNHPRKGMLSVPLLRTRWDGRDDLKVGDTRRPS